MCLNWDTVVDPGRASPEPLSFDACIHNAITTHSRQTIDCRIAQAVDYRKITSNINVWGDTVFDKKKFELSNLQENEQRITVALKGIM